MRDDLVAHRAFQELARRVARQGFVAHVDDRRDLERREMFGEKTLEFARIQLLAVLQHQCDSDFFAEAFVGYAEDRRLVDRGVLVDRGLDFGKLDPDAVDP